MTSCPSRAQIKFCAHTLAGFAYTLLFTFAMCGLPGFPQASWYRVTRLRAMLHFPRLLDGVRTRMSARAQGWMTREGVFSPEIIPIEEMALWVCSLGKISEEVTQARLGQYLFGAGGLYNIVDVLQATPLA